MVSFPFGLSTYMRDVYKRQWQNLPYEEQIKAKQKQVEDQLTRIGKIELPEFRPIMGSVKTQE